MSGAIKAAIINAYEYVFSTAPVNLIQDEFFAMLKRFFSSLGDSLVALCYIAAYTSLVVAKLIILVFPHAVKIGNIVVDFHMTKLSRTDLMLEGVSITTLLTCFIFRVRIQRAWTTFINYISVKSKMAAKAAPHVMFFSTAIVFSIVGRNFLIPLTHSAVMPLFTLIVPLAATVRLLYQLKHMDEKNAQAAISAKNLLWVIVAIYHALVTLGSLVPFSGSMLKYLPYAKEMVIVVMVWVQLSPVFSRIVFESVISKIMVRLCALIPAGYSVEQTHTKTSTFISVLKMMYLVNDSQLAFLQALFQDSVATIIAALFIFTPNPLAMVGTVVIALLLPAFRTSAVVASAADSSGGSAGELAKLARPAGRGVEASKRDSSAGTISSSSSSGRGKGSDSGGGGSALGVDHVLSTHWLRYWVCLSALWCVRIYAIKPWASVLIVSTLWLQHSYFQGSARLTAFIVDAAKAIAERNKRIEEERGWNTKTPGGKGRREEGGDEHADEGICDEGEDVPPSSASKFSFAGLFSPRTPAAKRSNNLTSRNNTASDGSSAISESKERIGRNSAARSGQRAGLETAEGSQHDHSEDSREYTHDKMGETHDNRPVTRQNAGSISPGPFSIGWGATTRTPAKTGTGGGGSPIVTGAGNSYSPAADYQKVASAHKRGSGGGSAGSSSGGRSQRGAKKVD